MKIPVRECAGGIVINDKSEIGVVKSTHRGFPKGGRKRNETPLKNAKREVKEEMGNMKLKKIKELGTYDRPSKSGKIIKRITLYLFTTVQDFNDIKIENVEDLKIKEIGGYCLDDLYKILGHSKDLEFLKNNEQEILPYIARRTKEALVLEK